MDFTLSYLGHFIDHLWFSWPLLGMLALTISVLGLMVGLFESWSRFDSVYWAFITATTVGYGDIRPKRLFSRVMSIVIALIGVTFTGIIVALAINSAELSFDEVLLPGAQVSQSN
jgi:voltage-gated potassium channel